MGEQTIALNRRARHDYSITETVEAGIVELVKDLGKQFGTSMIFVSHNLGLIRETCDRITVMYSGEAVETGNIDDVISQSELAGLLKRYQRIAGFDKEKLQAAS
mgnify:CR=1 FL=1